MAASTARSAWMACGGTNPPGAMRDSSIRMSVMVLILEERLAERARRAWARGCRLVREVFLREALQIFPDRALGAGAAQAVGRVVGHDELGAAPAIRFSSHAADGALDLQQQLRRELAEAADDPRLERLELAHEIGRARLDFVRQRIAVLRRAALE